MIPTRRRLAIPLLSLAVLVAVPATVGADQGRGGGSDKPEKSDKSDKVGSEDSTTTSTEAVVTTVTLPPSSSDPSTASTTTVVSATSTTVGFARRQLATKLGELITKLEKSKVPAETRDALLARLRAMRDAVLTGATPSEADLKAVMRDLEAAFSRSGSTTTTAAGSTVPGATPTSPTSTTASGKRFDPTRVLEQLDQWSAKVTGSNLPEADKATLLAAIERLRGLVAAGPVAPAELELVKTAVSRALEADHDDEDHAGSSTTIADGAPSSSAPETSQPPRPKGRAAVDAAIQTVTNSPLPDGLKQQILGVLTEAKTIIEDPTLTPEQVAERLRELHRAEQQRRLDEAAAKLVRFSEKIAILAFDSGTLPGAGDVLVEVEALLAEANALLAAESPDIETVKAAWKLLHQARTTLQQFLEASAPA